MISLRKEDRATTAKLLGAIVVVFGFAAVRVLGATSPSVPTPPTATLPAPQSTAESSSKGSIRLSDLDVPATANPFRTIAPTLSPPPLTAVVPKAEPVAPTPFAIPSTPVHVEPLPAAVPSSPVLSPPSAAPATKPTIHVTGIVGGPNATAVLEVDGESSVVRVGKRLDDGSVVVRIDTAAVTIRQDGKARVLDVGD